MSDAEKVGAIDYDALLAKWDDDRCDPVAVGNRMYDAICELRAVLAESERNAGRLDSLLTYFVSDRTDLDDALVECVTVQQIKDVIDSAMAAQEAKC